MAERALNLPTLLSRVHELARQMGLAGFWAWWIRQLDSLVPAAPRAALAHRRMRPVLLFESDHATLWRPVLEEGRATMQQGPSIALGGDAAVVAVAGRAALAPLTPMVYGGASAGVRLVVAVPAREVLRKTIVLPAAVEEDLVQALTYDLDRHTPFKADELYFDATITRRDPARGMVDVDLAAVRRAIVDPALRHAGMWGAVVSAVVPAAANLATPSRVNLLPLALRPAKSFWRRWQLWVPLAAVVLLAVAAVVVPLWQKRDYAIQLNLLADQARAQAAISETLRLELTGKVDDYNNALERKYAYPGALQTVDYVSKLLPDDTWLTQLELKRVAKGKEIQHEVLVRGETGNAGRLVQLFEDTNHFAQTAPRAPTTKIQPGPGEIFDLGALVKPRTMPERAALIAHEPAPGAAAPDGTGPGTAPVAAGAPTIPPPAAPATAGVPSAPVATGAAPAPLPAKPAASSGPAPVQPVPAASTGSAAPAASAVGPKVAEPTAKGKP